MSKYNGMAVVHLDFYAANEKGNIANNEEAKK